MAPAAACKWPQTVQGTGMCLETGKNVERFLTSHLCESVTVFLYSCESWVLNLFFTLRMAKLTLSPPPATRSCLKELHIQECYLFHGQHWAACALCQKLPVRMVIWDLLIYLTTYQRWQFSEFFWIHNFWLLNFQTMVFSFSMLLLHDEFNFVMAEMSLMHWKPNMVANGHIEQLS